MKGTVDTVRVACSEVAYRRTMKGTVDTVRVACSEVKDKKMRKRYIVTRNTGPCFWLILAPFFEKLIEERKTCTKILQALSRQTQKTSAWAPRKRYLTKRQPQELKND